LNFSVFCVILQKDFLRRLQRTIAEQGNMYLSMDGDLQFGFQKVSKTMQKFEKKFIFAKSLITSGFFQCGLLKTA